MNTIFYLFKVDKTESQCNGALYLSAYYSNGEEETLKYFKYGEAIPTTTLKNINDECKCK